MQEILEQLALVQQQEQQQQQKQKIHRLSLDDAVAFWNATLGSSVEAGLLDQWAAQADTTAHHQTPPLLTLPGRETSVLLHSSFIRGHLLNLQRRIGGFN